MLTLTLLYSLKCDFSRKKPGENSKKRCGTKHRTPNVPHAVQERYQRQSLSLPRVPPLGGYRTIPRHRGGADTNGYREGCHLNTTPDTARRDTRKRRRAPTHNFKSTSDLKPLAVRVESKQGPENLVRPATPMVKNRYFLFSLPFGVVGKARGVFFPPCGVVKTERFYFARVSSRKARILVASRIPDL